MLREHHWKLRRRLWLNRRSSSAMQRSSPALPEPIYWVARSLIAAAQKCRRNLTNSPAVKWLVVQFSVVPQWQNRPDRDRVHSRWRPAVVCHSHERSDWLQVPVWVLQLPLREHNPHWGAVSATALVRLCHCVAFRLVLRQSRIDGRLQKLIPRLLRLLLPLVHLAPPRHSSHIGTTRYG